MVRKYDYPLKSGDIITFRKKYQDIFILYEDAVILAAYKPHNMLTVSDLKEKEKTLYFKVSSYVKEKNKKAKIFVVHRLDLETSGIVIFAKSKEVQEMLQNHWKDVKRYYVAVLHGKVESGILKYYLMEDKNLFVHVTNKSKSSKLAITKYSLLAYKKDYSLVQIQIESGRKHQIRVSFKEINHPILGDRKYGIKDSFKHLYLCANEICFVHPKTKEKIHIKLEVPKEFIKLVH
jgi:23S rRNA pseudouridine1911/1915/1917 synthase